MQKVLKYEGEDYYDELTRQHDKEITFYNLSEKEIKQLYTEDKYFVTKKIFSVLSLDITVLDIIRKLDFNIRI